MADNCPTTAVIAIHERECPRPAHGSGVGFPVASSVSDIVPMLVDMRHDFLKDWSHINLIHDRSVNTDTLHSMIDGIVSAEGLGIRPTSVTTFRVDVNRRRITPTTPGSVDHTKCLTDPGKRFSSKHLARHIQEDLSLTNFIVMGKARAIEDVVEEV